MAQYEVVDVLCRRAVNQGGVGQGMANRLEKRDIDSFIPAHHFYSICPGGLENIILLGAGGNNKGQLALAEKTAQGQDGAVIVPREYQKGPFLHGGVLCG